MSVVIHRPGALGSSTDQDFSRCRVLVLDPFIGTRRLIIDMLIRDMRVAAAVGCSTLPDAARMLDSGDFNILITDWSGEINALEILALLRAPDSTHRFLPVVVMTAYNSAVAVQRARDAGMSEFMLKPFSAMVVQSRLKSITQQPRLFVETSQYFGPDRRRRRDGYEGVERRSHTNYRYADRRRQNLPPPTQERRQGRPGFGGEDRRADCSRK